MLLLGEHGYIPGKGVWHGTAQGVDHNPCTGAALNVRLFVSRHSGRKPFKRLAFTKALLMTFYHTETLRATGLTFVRKVRKTH